MVATKGMSPSAEAAVAPRLFPLYLHGLAFLGGFNVMLLEMCAFRVLETTFGSSIYVTGGLLALVMIALTVGYYLGGRFSKRFGTPEFLLGVLLASVAYVVLMGVVLNEPMMDLCFGMRGLFTSSLMIHAVPPAVATVVLYAPPMIALSHVSPFLMRMLSTRAQEPGAVGATAGNLMAVSNVGSIAGTLLPSFVFIPLWGAHRTLGVFIGSMLFIITVGLVLLRRRTAVVAVASLTLVGGVGVPVLMNERAPAPSLAGQEVLFEAESQYGNVKILRSTDTDGDERLDYMPSRDYVHSTVYPSRPLKDQFTTAYVNVGLARGARRYLILGAALGGAMGAVLAANPDAQITAVEIDPLVVELAQRHVPSLRSPNVKFVVEDARLFLREDTSQYDYIVVDVFSGEQLPTHCVTQEFFALARARLAPDGVMQMNTNLWDFQVTTGTEDPALFVSVRHLHSALLHVGFASLFQNDFFEHGHLYAFNQKTDVAQVRQGLTRMALDPRVEPHLRASVGLTALVLFPIDDARRELAPFTDEWVPEHRLQLKGNFENYLAALNQASHQPEWRRLMDSQTNPPLRLISARHYAQVGDKESATLKGYRAYMKGEGGAAYCQDVLAWAARAPAPELFPEMARYLHTRVIHDCSERLTGPDASPGVESNTGRLREYTLAAALVDDNNGAKAVPHLTGLLEGFL